MSSVFKMGRDEFRRYVMTLAHGFAAHSRQSQGASDDEAWAWAANHWQEFVGRAIDCAALLESVREAEEAAPWN